MADVKLTTGFSFAPHQPQLEWRFGQMACLPGSTPDLAGRVSGWTACCGDKWRCRLHGVRFAAERNCFIAGGSEDLDVRTIA